jgi:hypothetical protein
LKEESTCKGAGGTAFDISLFPFLYVGRGGRGRGRERGERRGREKVKM